MEKNKIKVVFTDFDRTLVDSSSIEHFYHGRLTKEEEKEKRGLAKDLPLVEGWREVFKELEDRGVIFAIVSRNQKTFLEFMIRKLKISPKTIVGRYGIGAKWPNLRALDKSVLIGQALEALNLPDIKLEEVVYVGDQAIDMTWAKEFGVKAAACFWATGERELLENSPYDFRLESPKDLLKYL